MSRMSRVLFLLLAAFVTVGLAASNFDLAAQDKKDKKDAKKDKKEEPKDKKEEKKEEKKEPFKPDMPAQEFTYILKGEKDETGKTFWVTGVAFGADGKTVAAIYRDNTVKIWDLAAKKDAVSIKAPAIKGLGEYHGLLYTNDQLFVGTGQLIKATKEKEKAKEPEKEKDKAKEKDKDKAKDKAKEKEKEKERPIRFGEIKVFDAKTGKPGPSLIGHNLNIEGLAISKDGKDLASASDDGTVMIWSIATGKDTQTIKGHADTVTGVAFSPDGKQLVTTSLDKTLRVWDIAGAKEIASFKIEREVEIKDAKGKVTKQKELGRDFTRAVFTSDGKKLIAANRDGVIKIYDIEGKKELQELKAHEGILALALSPDGKFASAGYDGLIKIWAAEGKDLKTIKAHVNPIKSDEPGSVTSLSFSGDGMLLASGGVDGVVKIWSVK
jgi:WD40 repeat protein